MYVEIELMYLAIQPLLNRQKPFMHTSKIGKIETIKSGLNNCFNKNITYFILICYKLVKFNEYTFFSPMNLVK